MNELYEWIRNITYYLIFITVAVNLLPDRKYEKFFKLFSGLVLILLVLKPLTGSLRLDDKIAYYFESISFRKEADELSTELSDMEKKRLTAMINQYEEAVETDLKSMAETAGFGYLQGKVIINQDEGSAAFGHVLSVYIQLTAELSRKPNAEVEPVEQVKAVKIESVGKDEITGMTGKINSENSKLVGLKRRIAEYYDLEERDIEIQLEDGKG